LQPVASSENSFLQAVSLALALWQLHLGIIKKLIRRVNVLAFKELKLLDTEKIKESKKLVNH